MARMPRFRNLSILVAVELIGLAALVVFSIWLVRRVGLGGRLPATVTLAPPPTEPAAAATPRPSATAPPPAASATPVPPSETPAPTPTVAVKARVAEGATGLRLRVSPGTAGEVVREMDAGTALTVVGRTADSAWLEVYTALQEHGWVSAVYVDVDGDVEPLAVTGTAEDAPLTEAGYLSGVTSTSREIFLHGVALGNRADVFSKVGDSNTDNPAFLYPFDYGSYDLGDYGGLQLTIDYFKGSFSRSSAAAKGGFSTSKVLDPANADGRCQGGETPLACEYRLNRPAVALILLGTGDQHTWQGFEARYRQIIEYSIDQGVIPVLMTKADDLESLENTAPAGFTNSMIRQLAQEYDVPLLDLRRAVESLPNHGCIADGFHYSTPPDGRAGIFDADHLQYGYTVRNLTALQALDALRQYVLYSP
jgi:hypothetical protein